MSALLNDHGPMDSHSDCSADRRALQDHSADQRVVQDSHSDIVQTQGLCNFNPTDSSTCPRVVQDSHILKPSSNWSLFKLIISDQTLIKLK